MQNIKKHSSIILTLFLIALCYIIYFINIGNYPLIDTDETKYVTIARDMIKSNDWINLKLNGENYFENAPLLFWIIDISFIAFGKISAYTARFPIALAALAGIVILYISISKILTKTFAIISALICSVSLGFLIFSHIATTDMIYTISTMITILCGYIILFGDRNTKKEILWFILYIFMAISIMVSGIFGLLIPLISIITMYIFAGKSREIIKFPNILIGGIIILSTVIPWFYIMIKNNGISFIEAVYKSYNFIEYINIKKSISVIGLFLLGFLPWTFSFLWILGTKFKSILSSFIMYFKDNSESKLKEKWKNLSKTDKFLSVNTIVFFTTLIFAVLYGYKYTYLTLFMIFPASCITGYYWYEYLFRHEHDRSILFATMIPNLLFIISSLVGIIGFDFIKQLSSQGFSYLIIPMAIIFFVIPLFGIFSVILKGRMLVYISNLILMISLSFVISPGVFNYIAVNGGETDLIKFSQEAEAQKIPLTTYMPSKKYSIVYYYDGHINFHKNNDIKWLREYMNKNPNHQIITEIKELWDIEKNKTEYLLIDSGKRYCVIKKLPKINTIKKEEKPAEPEIIVY